MFENSIDTEKSSLSVRLVGKPKQGVKPVLECHFGVLGLSLYCRDDCTCVVLREEGRRWRGPSLERSSSRV